MAMSRSQMSKQVSKPPQKGSGAKRKRAINCKRPRVFLKERIALLRKRMRRK